MPRRFDSLAQCVDGLHTHFAKLGHTVMEGLLQKINGADWKIEIGAITEVVAFSTAPRILLFDSIQGYPPGFRVVTNLYSAQRLQAIALGLPDDVPTVELISRWRTRSKQLKPTKPRTVSDGPILQNVIRGSDVNLLKFPVPLWREHDGGRFLGTGDVVVTRENLGARRLGRAGFVGVIGAGIATLFYGKAISRVTSRVTNPIVDATGLTRIIPSSGWRIYTVAATMPHFDPATWRLRIDGLVEQPVELSYQDLLALPKADQITTFHCVTGWIVNNVRWGGVRFHDLLASAKPLPQAGALHFISAEQPYDDFLDTRQVALPEVMLAYEMDGKPLSQAHGAPVRVVIPEMYGYKNVKWVERIEVVKRPGSGYWEQRGYDNNAWVGRSNGYGSRA